MHVVIDQMIRRRLLGQPRGGEMTKQDATEQIASLDGYLMPDDQKRYLVFVFRLPQHLPVYHHFGRVLAMPGDLGDEWGTEAFLSTVPDGPGYFTNLREPSV